METHGWAVRVPSGYRVGTWEVRTPIATGSWASTYEARRVGDVQPRGDAPQRVALKFLPTGTLSPRQLSHLADMARREIQLYERLTHPRLARFFEALTVDDQARPELDGASVLVMERAEESLADTVRRGGGNAVPRAPAMLVEMCDGLAHMHAAGWVHGDLKPSNVLVMSDGSVRLADFGLATQLDGTHGYLPPAGSSDYLPPERWAEPLTERGTAVRTTADIWALGVTAHQMLTGLLPFPGTTPRARAAAAAEYAAGRTPLVLAPGLAPGWQSFIEDCLAPSHEQRLNHDAASLLARARALADGPSPGSGTTARAKASRARRAAVAGAAVVLLGSGTGMAVTYAPRVSGAGSPAPAVPQRSDVAGKAAASPRCTYEDLDVRDDSSRHFTSGRTCHAYASSPVYANVRSTYEKPSDFRPLDDSGYMHGQVDVWVICQHKGRENPVIQGNRNTWWLYTQGDAARANDYGRDDAWGYLPATAIAQGGQYEPIPGAPVCPEWY